MDAIDDSGIHELLASMLERNPTNRKNAETYLAQARGSIFPEYFYSFLQSYMLIFSASPILSNDEKIYRLKKDIGNIINILKKEENEKLKVSQINSEKTEDIPSEENIIMKDDDNQNIDKNDLHQTDTVQIQDTSQDIERETQIESETDTKSFDKQTCDIELKETVSASTENLEGLVIITQLITSCIRGLHHTQSKLQSLEILLEVAENISDEIILDRILPYIVSILFSFK